MLVIGPIAPLGLLQDIEAALTGAVSFYKQHYFLLQYWCCISFLPPSLLAHWHSVQLDFCLIWQKRMCEEIKCRVNFHWSHFQKHQISQKLWDRRDNAECTWRKRPLLLRIMLIVLLKHQYWDYAYTISAYLIVVIFSNLQILRPWNSTLKFS